MHVGEHAGATHSPAVQMPEPQSLPAPHTLPSGQVGLHAGGAHVPPVQIPDAHSLPEPHM
jgi:hypothetical protein